MGESKMPARIWATCNGMSTRLPDGHRQFIGGWSEDKDRPRAERFIRADLVEPLEHCQSALAMMIAPEAIKSTSVLHAFAQATEAECRARAAILRARQTEPRHDES